jgi:hypothetical protein
MLGLLFKVFLFFAVIIFGVFAILDVTNVWNPGTLALTRPGVEPCQRYADQYLRDRKPHIVEVRWIMTSQNYGWGCYFEYDISDSITVSPMPK